MGAEGIHTKIYQDLFLQIIRHDEKYQPTEFPHIFHKY